MSKHSTGGDILPQSSVRNLGDRLYEKRKTAALEIEQLVKEFQACDDSDGILQVIDTLTRNFAYSTQANNRKGGLIGLAATAIGLTTHTEQYLHELVHPVLKCFTDQDSRVRYYACEAFYNISKVARGGMMTYFNEIFDGLCKLIADSDPNVQNGAQLVDRLMKDIVTEVETFDMDKFIPMLGRRIKVGNPHVRQFVVGWISVLDSVPHIHMLDYLPQYLAGLFEMLSDRVEEVTQRADAALAEFLRDLGTVKNVECGPILTIALKYGESKDDFTRSVALTWIGTLIGIGRKQVFPFVAQILSVILPGMSQTLEAIRNSAARTNRRLRALIKESEDDTDLDLDGILIAITLQLVNQWKATRLAALRWISTFLAKYPDKIRQFLEQLFPVLLKTLSDPSDEIVKLDLEVISRIALNEDYFNLFFSDLVKLFSTDRQLLEKRAGLVLRQLARMLSPEKIFRKISSIVEGEEDLEFASVMVQTLNLILLTSPEMFELRTLLKNIASKEGGDLFTVLYGCWSHSPGATFSLCLLSEAYGHATTLVYKFAELQVTVPFLMELDKLVRLLESPVFAHVRLALLEPKQNPELFQCLYGILMLLPQSAAFHTLRNRLSSVINLASLVGTEDLKTKSAPQGKPSIDFESLLTHFEAVQAKHAQHRLKLVQPGAAGAGTGGHSHDDDDDEYYTSEDDTDSDSEGEAAGSGAEKGRSERQFTDIHGLTGDEDSPGHVIGS